MNKLYDEIYDIYERHICIICVGYIEIDIECMDILPEFWGVGGNLRCVREGFSFTEFCSLLLILLCAVFSWTL
jgi:hypothetical protein